MTPHKPIHTLSQVKIGQVAKWLKLLEGFTEQKYSELKNNLEFKAQVVSIMLDITMNQARAIDIDDLLQISDHYINLFASYRYREPLELVEVNGQKFRFSKSTGAWGTGQIIDAKLITPEQIFEHPERLLAVLYIEDGMRYFQEDERQQVLNPTERREALFKEHFSGEEFWHFVNFFLSNCENWKLAISGIQIARMRIAAKNSQKILKRRQRQMKMRGSILHKILLRLQRNSI